MGTKWLFAVAVPLLGLVELGGHLVVSTRAPDLDEWRSAKAPLLEEREGDELVVVAPHWAEPNARHAFGDALMPLHHVARADETAFPRAIEVSILGARAPELEGWKVVSEREAGKFVLRHLENPAPAKVVHSFVDHVADARVRDVWKDGERACAWKTNARRSAGGLHGDPAYPATRHECGGGSWHFVGVTVVEDEAWRGRRCIWAHPAQGKTLTITYDDVPIGAVVRGYATIPWWIERKKKGAPVELEVRVDGESLGSFVHVDGDAWNAFELPTKGAAGKRGQVEFRIWSRQSRHRQMCFVAEMR